MLGVEWTSAANKAGDQLCRSSLPENYFKNTGDKLINLGVPYLKYNPYCLQQEEIHSNTLSRVERRSLWRYSINSDNSDCKTMAHEICRSWGLEKCYLTQPRIYIHKDSKPFPRTICINTTGSNQGAIPLYVLNYIAEKYRPTHLIYQIGGVNDVDMNCDFDRRGCSWEDSAKILAECEIFIGLCSFCYWLAKCYPKTHRKIILVNKDEKRLENWLPRGFPGQSNPFDTWIEFDGSDIFNTFDNDIGVTKSYLEI